MKKLLVILLLFSNLSYAQVDSAKYYLYTYKKPITKRDSLHIVRKKRQADNKINNFNNDLQNKKDHKKLGIFAIILYIIGINILR